MRQMIEVPDSAPEGYDLASLMLAEHGPMGIMLLLIGALMWKVGIPFLQKLGDTIISLFRQFLEQSKESNARLVELTAAVEKGDENNRASIAALRESVDASTKAMAARVDKVEGRVHAIELGHVEHEHRLRGLEYHAGVSGAFKRPTPPPTHD